MKRVLLVEDNDDVRATLSDILQDAGYAVSHAESFSVAAAMLSKSAFDLVVTNAMLPGGPGADIYSKAMSLGIPAVIITGHPDQMRIFEANGTPYMPKPFRAGEFIDVLKRHTARG